MPKKAMEGTYIDPRAPMLIMYPSAGGFCWCGDQDEDAEDHCHPQRLPPLQQKHNHFEKCHKKISVHLSPCIRDVQIGDTATVGKCWPLSKTVSFNVLLVMKAATPRSKSRSSEIS
ncbi:40S ribosomal protein S11-like [Canis lupus dingo]|uniref:40S ribosomal protein S11-like n=1 Tax=Canis lupus dingo TaxID=286419 RepID=UPI0015F1BDD7|nr:40S ribosomal protein S11-like [Canis lupus dingo]